MQGVITFENVTFLIAIVATIFSVYHFFRKPDVDADKRICLLEQLLQSEQSKNTELIKSQANHLHTLEKAIESNCKGIEKLQRDNVKLFTILEERLPQK